MTISSSTLKLLVDAGLSGQALIDVVSSIENDNKPKDRTANAERQARFRARKAVAVDNVTSNVTNNVTEVTQKDTPLVPPSLSPAPLTLPPIIPPEKTRSSEKWPFGKPNDVEFEDFWSQCPRRVGKMAAQRRFFEARKLAPADKISRAMREHARAMEKTEEQFIPHPATWLNQGRYLDQNSATSDPQNAASLRIDMAKWQIEIAEIIGDAPTKTWFMDAALEDEILIAATPFKKDFIVRNYAADLKRIGIEHIESKGD